jgi:TP901 family phage tail tape measure protein
MADSQTNININIDTSQALANLKALQSQISAFQTQMARGSATQAAAAAKLRQNLINDINAAGKFNASIQNIKTTTESFTESLEKNKLSMGQYFRYAGGATKNFGKLFKSEMSTIDKVARERVKTLQTQYIQLGRDASGAMKAIAVRPLVLDMENLGTKTAIAAQKQQILNQLLKQGSTNLLNWGKNTQWAGRQLMVGFTVPLTMAGTAAAKMYMELEKASIKFKRVYGDFNTTAKDVEDMSKNLQALAQEFTKYGVAVADTMNMAATAAAAGKTGLELIEQVSNATRLAVLGSVEQEQALETTISLTNAFGLAAEELSGKIDFLNSVENQTVTSIEDLTIAIPKAAPVVQQLGGNVEDLTFFLTAMKEGGINASEGANALKSGLASLINPTGKASEFLASFGVNVKGIVEANKGDVKGLVLDFASALDTLDPLNRARAIEQMFGKFQFSRLSTLFQNVVKEGSQAQRVLELSNATSEELAILSERELKKVENSPMFKFQKAVEDVKVRLAPIGEAFLKAITPVISFVGKFLDGFNKMSEGAKSFWITFTGLVAGVGPLLLMSVGLIGNGVANLIKMFVGIKSFINRTTQETGMLGESTSYMTETQLRAAAVAASLDQVHQQLTQRFTSEAAAVDALTAAYGRNITAQGAYGPMGASPTTIGKKYADGGIISGPGTGTSDSIVAMVSNGEAVIPAKSVARNPELVKALIAGNVPRFAQGHISGQFHSYSNAVQYIPGNLNRAMGKEGANAQQISANASTETYAPIIAEAIGHSVGDMSPETLRAEMQRVPEFAMFANDLAKAVAQEVGDLTTKVTDEVYHEINTRKARELAKSDKYAGNVGPSIEKVLDTQTAFEDDTVRRITGKGTNKGIGRRQLALGQTTYESTSRKRAYEDMYGLLGGDASTLDGQQLSHIVKRGDMSVSDLASVQNPTEFTSGAVDRFNRGVVAVAQRGGGSRVEIPASSTGAEIRAAGTGKVVAQQDGANDAQAYEEAKKAKLDQPQNDPYMEVRDRNSPHRLSGQDGADDAKSYNQGFNSVPPTPPGGIPGVEAPQAQGPVARTLKDKLVGVANTIKDKGTDLVSRGINAGKAKVVEAGQGFVDRWNQSIDDEIAASQRAHGARVQVADQLLLATDQEYLALTTQQEIYKQKLLATNEASEQEIQEAVTRDQILQQKRGILVEEMKENGVESEVIQERIRLAKERGVAIDAEQMNNADQRSSGGGSRLANLSTRLSGKMTGFLMTTSMVSGGLSMVGGKLGELAQQITPVIGGMSMLMMMIQNMSTKAALATIALAAIGLVIYGFMQYKEAIGRGIDSVLEFNDAIGSGTKAIQGLATFAGNVSASEIMDKRRQQQLNPYQVVSGKTTFGENFAKSEDGTAMADAIGKSTAALGSGTTKSALMSQLSTAVLSNAITTQQARSIAINIGRKMGNVEMGIQIAGELSSLLGPNGENILENGIDIRVKLIEDSRQQMTTASNTLAQNGARTQQEVGTAAMGTVAGVAGGALAGIGAGLTVAAGIAALGGPVGWVVGAVTAVAAIAGGIYGYFKSSEAYAERLGKLSAANVAIQANALNQQKQMVDSLELDYEKRIAAAQAAGDTAKADELQNRLILDRQKLLDQNVKTMSQIEESFRNSQYQDEMLSGVEKAIGKKYKDTAMEDIAAAALSNIQSNVGDKTQRYQLEMLLNTTVDPMAMLFLTDLMATDSSVIDKAINISANLTGTGLNDILAISSMFTDENGKPNTTVQTNFIAKMSTVTDGETSKNLMDMYRELGRMKDNWINVPVLVDFVSKNPAVEAELMEDIDQIRNLPQGKLSVDIVQNANIMNPEEMAILRDDVEYFNSIDTREGQQIYLQYVSTLSGTVTENDPGFKAWLSAEGKQFAGQGAYAQTKYIQWLAERATKTRLGDNAFVEPPKTPKSGSGGPSASWLDDYVKGVRDLTDASQKLTVGYDASSKALQAFAKKGAGFKNTFAGLATNLYSAGISQDIIDNILGMPKEEADKYMKLFFDKNGKITNFVKQMNQISAIAKLRQAEESGFKATKSIYDRVDATKALVMSNQNSALSSEMLADADMVVALAGVKLIGNQKEQKKQIDMLTKSKLASLAADRLSKGAIQNEIDDAQVRIDTLEAQSNVYQNSLDIISKRAEKINEAYDRQIQALQEVKSINDEINRQKQGELDLADALSRGDIGAAAKAAQQLRAQQAQAAADAQIKALEDAKKRAVDTLTVEINGQRFTRVDLEQKMYDISLQVLEIKKDEIVQNEVILAKQKETLNTLIAQTAEQIKKNAEASKPITQIIKKIITSSGGGDGKVDPVVDPVDPKKDTPAKPTSDPGIGKVWKLDPSTNTWKVSTVAQPTVGVGDKATTLPSTWDPKTGTWKVSAGAQAPAMSSPEGDRFAKGAGISKDQPIAPTKVTAKDFAKSAVIPMGRYFKMPAGNYFLGYRILESGDVAIDYGSKPNSQNKQMVGSLQKMEIGFDGKATPEYWQKFAKGGMVMPKYFSIGDVAKGTDVVPAMLTPGEFVVTQSAVKNFGIDNLRSINNGTYGGNSVYNYSVNVNVSNSGANANDIAQTVMSQIRQIDAQRIRSNNL